MASRTITVLTDDLTGKELDGDGRTITFSYKSKDYTLDLSQANLEKFEKALEPYLKAAHKISGGRGSRSSRASADLDPKAVRAWAQSNGVELSARGRVPASVVQQYKAAGN
jgi:hypothetical protein